MPLGCCRGQGHRASACCAACLPAACCETALVRAGREPDEVAFEWVREYTFSVNNPHDPSARNTFWFLFGDGRVTYNDLNTRLEVKKRARKSESDFQRPAQVRPALRW